MKEKDECQGPASDYQQLGKINRKIWLSDLNLGNQLLSLSIGGVELFRVATAIVS